MDLRAYYQRIRKIEAGIGDAFAVVVSRDTRTGGAGGLGVVPRSLAARLIADEKVDWWVRRRSRTLLTDGNPNTGRLEAYESSILSVANTEWIDLDLKMGLATEEISQGVLDFLMDHTSGSAAARRALGVSDVVVSRQMKRWHAVHTLEVLYRDTFIINLMTGIGPRLSSISSCLGMLGRIRFGSGIGLVSHPIPEAAPPVFSAVAGTLPDATYYARVAWVSSAGVEGGASEVTTL